MSNATGYRSPPVDTRFRKGQSGNPKGRPRGSKRQPPCEAVLGQRVTIREDGCERTVTAGEAFLLYLAKKGLGGDDVAARYAEAAMAAARARREPEEDKPDRLIISWVAPGSVNGALERLRMGVKLDRFGDNARMAIEPWIVEAALARLGDQRLSLEQQQIILRATRTPKKVRWPDWWEALPEKV